MFLLKNEIRSASAAVLIVLALAAAGFADTVRLKDGSTIKGRIVSFGGGRFTVAVGEGARRKELLFAADEVESISFDRPADVAGSAYTGTSTSNASYSSGGAPVKTSPKVVTTENIPPRAAPVAKSLPASPSAVSSKPSSTSVKPVQVSVKVRADNTANGWTNSGWIVKKGQRIRISAAGTVSLGKGRTTGPAGLAELEDQGKLLKSVPTGALIAVVGDDNNDFIYIGLSREFTASRDGALFLGVNEENLVDNSGSFDVTVEIDPLSGT